MPLLVRGGAGFIGANFVLDWIAGSDEPVVNLDKLTYASLFSGCLPFREVYVRADMPTFASRT